MTTMADAIALLGLFALIGRYFWLVHRSGK